MPGAFTFNLFSTSRDRPLHFIAVGPSSEKLGNWGKVTQLVHTEARVRNLPLKVPSQACRAESQGASERQPCVPQAQEPGPSLADILAEEM